MARNSVLFKKKFLFLYYNISEKHAIMNCSFFLFVLGVLGHFK